MTVGPYALIGANSVLAEGCSVAAHAQLLGRVELGPGSRIGNAAIIGGDPQDLSFDTAIDSGVRIGANCILREHVTIHRSTVEGGWTEIGDDNFLMIGTHLGHDVRMGRSNIIANNSLFAGHVQIGDGAFIGGSAVFHQFIHLGDLCMIQGNSTISQDVPPYCLACQSNRIAGLNTVGLRRAGLDAATRAELKRVFRAAFLSEKPFTENLGWLQKQSWGEHATRFLDALAAPSRKGTSSPN